MQIHTANFGHGQEVPTKEVFETADLDPATVQAFAAEIAGEVPFRRKVSMPIGGAAFINLQLAWTPTGKMANGVFLIGEKPRCIFMIVDAGETPSDPADAWTRHLAPIRERPLLAWIEIPSTREEVIELRRLCCCLGAAFLTREDKSPAEPSSP